VHDARDTVSPRISCRVEIAVGSCDGRTYTSEVHREVGLDPDLLIGSAGVMNVDAWVLDSLLQKTFGR
jgi:hypothetical protein